MNVRRLKALFAGLVTAGSLAVPAVAAAESYVGGETPQVQGTELVRGSTAPASETRSSGLPITGADIAGLTVVGAASVGVGTVLVRRSRRARTA